MYIKKDKLNQPADDEGTGETEAPSGVDASLSGRGRGNSLTMDQLPPKLRGQLETFVRLAPSGLAARPELLYLASAAGCFNTGPLSEQNVSSLLRHLLKALSHMELGHDAGIEDLLLLKAHTLYADGRKYIALRNPHMDRFREAERAAVRPGYKRAGYDSELFVRAVSAVCAVARFNGEFVLPAQFRKHYPLRLDNQLRAERRHLKMMTLTHHRVDTEILKLNVEFDEILRRRSFLTDSRDLRLCLFLPELVAVRYLGLRQNNLLSCDLGKNIFFGPDKSVTFRFEPEGFGRSGAIAFTISAKLHSEISELLLTLQVLTKYKSKVLDVIRSQDRAYYQEVIGDQFFVSATSNGSRATLEPYMTVDSDDEPAKRGERARRRLREGFRRDAATFLCGAGEAGDLFGLTLASVHQLYLDWMHESLGIPWEEVRTHSGRRRPSFFNHFKASPIEGSETVFKRLREVIDRQRGAKADRGGSEEEK